MSVSTSRLGDGVEDVRTGVHVGVPVRDVGTAGPAAGPAALSRLSSKSRSEETLDAIKAYILEQRLHTGDALPTEAELCDHLGVSRSSVREAMRKLEALDIVKAHRGKGSFVGDMSLQPMVETIVLRNAMDSTSSREALREVAATRRCLDLGMSDDLIAAMRGTSNPELADRVDAMVDKASRGETYMQDDIAFHEGLVQYLGNPLLSQLTHATWLIHQAVIPDLGPLLPDGLRKTALAHRHMLDAAEAGDADAFRAAVREHYAPLELVIGGDDGVPAAR